MNQNRTFIYYYLKLKKIQETGGEIRLVSLFSPFKLVLLSSTIKLAVYLSTFKIMDTDT